MRRSPRLHSISSGSAIESVQSSNRVSVHLLIEPLVDEGQEFGNIELRSQHQRMIALFNTGSLVREDIDEEYDSFEPAGRAL